MAAAHHDTGVCHLPRGPDPDAIPQRAADAGVAPPLGCRHRQTGEVSRIGRGRHTTRHSEIYNVCKQTYICDTPGFTSLNLPDVEKEDLRFYFEEFVPFEGKCRFNGCMHVSEPGCAVKQAVEDGIINYDRYKSYTDIFEEIKNKKKY